MQIGMANRSSVTSMATRDNIPTPLTEEFLFNMWYNIYMKTIYTSASKIVFIIMTIALVALTFKGVVEAKDFIVLASMVFTYYFSRPPSTQSPSLG